MTIDRSARESVVSAIGQLNRAHASTEQLAEYVPARRGRLFTHRATFVRIAPVWRLGVFLLTADGRLFETGEVIKVREPKHPNTVAVSAEYRRQLRETALRAGFSTSDTVNFNALPLPLDHTVGTIGPLVSRDDELLVRWSRSPDALVPFDSYLNERVDLLANPPERA